MIGRHEQAATWLGSGPIWGGRPRTIDEYPGVTWRTSPRGANALEIESGCGLANATIQHRLVPVRLFYDFLVEEGPREFNALGRGRNTPAAGCAERSAAWYYG